MIVQGYKKGYYIWSNLPIDIEGFYLLNGQTITDSTFLQYIDSLDKNKSYFCTDEEYENDIIKYGTCSKFVYKNNQLKLPTTQNIIFKDIISYTPTILKERLNSYSINVSYLGLNSIEHKKYNKYNTNYRWLNVSTVDTYSDCLKGYMYLLIKDLVLPYYLDTDIPEVMLRKL